jgi:hypothetical protein
MEENTNQPKPEEIIELILRLTPYLKIANHIPGRIKIRFMLTGLSIIENVDLNNLVGSIPGILRTHVLFLFQCIIIEYDSERFPCDLWETLLQLQDNPGLIPYVRSCLQQLFNG